MNWFFRSIVLVAAGIIFIGIPAIVCFGIHSSTDSKEQEKVKNTTDGLKSDNISIHGKTVQQLLSNRKDIIHELVELVHPKNKEQYSKKTRSMAAYLLGEYRASEAAPVLAQSLSIEDDPGDPMSFDLSRYENPIVLALFKIGRPAIMPVIKNIESSDDRIVRSQSLGVMTYTLGGRRRTLEVLNRRKNEAEDQKVKERLKKACDKLTAEIAKFESKKDFKEPLF